MHSLLEEYLEEVAAHLAGLPAARRADELREMRAHLENAVIVGQERGRTEDEAARDALAQFGTPGALGDNLVQAWRRGEALNKRGFWGAVAFAIALTLWPNVPGRIGHWAEIHSSYILGLPPLQQYEVEVGLILLPSYFLCGVLCSAVFPKWGMKATAFTETGLIVLFVSANLRTFFVINTALSLVLMAQWVACPLAAILGAWAFNRWKGRKEETRNLRPAKWPCPPQDKIDRITKWAE